MQKESCCVSSSPLPLGRRSYQRVLWLLPPKSPNNNKKNQATSILDHTVIKSRAHAWSHSNTPFWKSSPWTHLCPLWLQHPLLLVSYSVWMKWMTFLCSQNVLMTVDACPGKTRKSTYSSSQFRKSILHHTDQLVSWSNNSSETSAGSSRQSPCVE